MNKKEKQYENYSGVVFEGERPLYGKTKVIARDCVFKDGESPVKECSDVSLVNCTFGWKYPVWYSSGVDISGGSWQEGARAGGWYCTHLKASDTVIYAPKSFRRCGGIILSNVVFHNAAETIWDCDGVKIDNVKVKSSSYFCMNSKNIEVDGLELDGDYAFDGAENVIIRNSVLRTKDAFWNSKNVTVYDSTVTGEYLGWNSENLTLVNCTVESLQGMCYIKGLKMLNCRTPNTTLAFEYSSVDAEISGGIGSVFNPLSGRIKADSIGELIMEKDRIDPSEVEIICPEIRKMSDRPEWMR